MVCDGRVTIVNNCIISNGRFAFIVVQVLRLNCILLQSKYFICSEKAFCQRDIYFKFIGKFVSCWHVEFWLIAHSINR